MPGLSVFSSFGFTKWNKASGTEMIGAQQINMIWKPLGKLKYRNGQNIQAHRSIHKVKVAMIECIIPDPPNAKALSDLPMINVEMPDIR